jgi:hypothetical protein
MAGRGVSYPATRECRRRVETQQRRCFAGVPSELGTAPASAACHEAMQRKEMVMNEDDADFVAKLYDCVKELLEGEVG